MIQMAHTVSRISWILKQVDGRRIPRFEEGDSKTVSHECEQSPYVSSITDKVGEVENPALTPCIALIKPGRWNLWR